MAVDYEAVAAGLSAAIPFNVHLRLQTTEVSVGRGVAVLPDAGHLHNHIGSQHAGALFAVGEAASGAAFVGTFLEKMSEVTPLAESAQISYRAIATGQITATARLAEDRDALLSKLEQEGRVRFPVQVQMTNADGDLVAEMTVNWYMRRK